MYKTKVFRGMTIDKYKEMKENNELPLPDFITYLSRDAHGDKSKYGKHSNQRYGSNNECPPGEYYLNSAKDSGGGGSYKIYLADTPSGRTINGVHGSRSGIAIHQYSPKFAIGCLTTASENDISPVDQLIDEIPDLLIHNQVNIERRHVRIILEEREVVESTWEDSSVGTTKWTGKIG